MSVPPKAPPVYKPTPLSMAAPPVYQKREQVTGYRGQQKPPSYRPNQVQPAGVQMKSAKSFRLETRPAPPVYRPQQGQVGVQPKAAWSFKLETRPAPPVYRPNQANGPGAQLKQTNNCRLETRLASPVHPLAQARGSIFSVVRPPSAVSPELQPRLQYALGVSAGRAVQRSSYLKSFEGQSASGALRRFGMVTATGTVTLPSGTKLGPSNCSNGGNFENHWPQDIYQQWQNNNQAAENEKLSGNKIPSPGHDAEALVIDDLIGKIAAERKKTNGGTLNLRAAGTSICKYCQTLIRSFCNYYGLTWENDPVLSGSSSSSSSSGSGGGAAAAAAAAAAAGASSSGSSSSSSSSGLNDSQKRRIRRNKLKAAQNQEAAAAATDDEPPAAAAAASSSSSSSSK